jgi:hypothetical protein
MPREEFKREVERHLTGKETEPWDMLYFKVYKSQLAVIEEALETASLMLGGQKARGYCPEMICADFLAGANLDVSGRPTPFSWHSVESTSCSRTHSDRSSCCGSRRHREFTDLKTTQASIGPGFLSQALSAGAGTRLLAMPRMRNVQGSPGPSHAAARPTGKRCGRKSHRPLQCLPSANPSP